MDGNFKFLLIYTFLDITTCCEKCTHDDRNIKAFSLDVHRQFCTFKCPGAIHPPYMVKSSHGPINHACVAKMHLN
jgi:hypothetical protein